MFGDMAPHNLQTLLANPNTRTNIGTCTWTLGEPGTYWSVESESSAPSNIRSFWDLGGGRVGGGGGWRGI